MLVGVDGGADALLEAGYQPDLIVGDLQAGVRRGAALRRRGRRARRPGRPRARPGAGAGLRGGRGPLPVRGHQRGHRAAARRHARRRAGRHRRHARHAAGVPGPGPGRDGLDVPDPAAARRHAGRRARRPAGSTAAAISGLAPAAGRARRAGRRRRRARAVRPTAGPGWRWSPAGGTTAYAWGRDLLS